MKISDSLLVFGLIATATAYAAPTGQAAKDPSTAPEKSHTLFMGVDVSVEKDKKFHRVRDVSRSSWIITIDGRPEIIPTERKALNLRVEQSLKLTEASATLANIKAERAYLPGNDPRAQAMRSQIHMDAYSTERVMAAEMTLSRTITDLAFYNGAYATFPPPDVEKAIRELAAASDFAASGINDQQNYQTMQDQQLRKEEFDAIKVEFEVSSEKPLPNPYIVVIAQFRPKESAPGTAQNWIYAQSLDPIEPTAKKIEVLRGGFPLGYLLDKVEVHLYDRGREVATNVSPKRVPLTRDEAFEYIVIEHIAGNKGATLAPSPVMVALPPELWTRLAAGQGQQVYYVKVSKDGLVEEAYEDEEYTQKIQDPFFADAVKKIWFKPALEKGKPVEAKTKVDVTKLRI